MAKLIVLGANGKAGRRIVEEALGRGHSVTGVVRDPARSSLEPADSLMIVAGDATDVDGIAGIAGGHDVLVSAVARLDVPSVDFYGQVTRAVVDGMVRAGVTRAVLVGMGTTLEVAPGTALHDTEGFPADARAFSLGHAEELRILEGSDPRLDWVVLAPPPVVLDESAPAHGSYRTAVRTALAPEEGGPTFSYADLGRVVVDEIEQHRHSRSLVAVARA